MAGHTAVDPRVRAAVGQMQRRAFELTTGWDDVEEEAHPATLARLGQLTAPTLVLVGAHDLDAIRQAAGRLADGVRGAVAVAWPDTAHLPATERPERFLALMLDWLAAR